jgi:hypothetical protein
VNPGSAIQFLISLLVLAVVMYCVWLVVSMLPLPQPIGTIVLVIFGLIALLWLLQWSGMWRGPPA